MKTFLFLTCCVFSSITAHAACTTSIAVSPIGLRDNNDGTVTQGKLRWQKCLEGITGENCENGTARFFTWEEALKWPAEVNAKLEDSGKPKNWRLPTIGELRDLVNEQCFDPAINSDWFPNTPSWNVWSITPFADDPSYAWHVDFYYGFAYITPKYGKLAVRLVRETVDGQ